jgi:hypothetical protein
MNETQINQLWEKTASPRYQKNPRNRRYNVSPEAKRQIAALWLSCKDTCEGDDEKATELFAWALEEFEKAGVNVLQPSAPADHKPPEMWKDIWGNPLPNPFQTNDLRGQTIVMQRDPGLAKWLKAFATDPYGAATSWADMKAQNLHLQSIKYDENTHLANVFANGSNETAKAKFTKDHPELVERLKFEAQPVAFPVGKTFDLTIQSRIAKNPKLGALLRGLDMHEKAFVEEARATAQAQRQAAEDQLKKLEGEA